MTSVGRPIGSVDLHGRAVRAERSYHSQAWREFRRDQGAQMRDTRRARAIAAEELAAAINVNVQTVFRWERGDGAPTLLSLVAVAKALGCSLVDLLPESARYP